MVSRGRQLFTDFLLLLVCFFWGSTFILVKNAVSQVDVFAFLAVRFSVALLLMVIVFHRRLWPIQAVTVSGGLFLGAVLFAAFAFQTWGLTITSATKGAFITGLNVAMVPVLSLVLLKRPPALLAAVGVLTAAMGLYILTGWGTAQWNRGDLLVLICAVWISLHILLTGRYAPQMDTLALATWQVSVVAALSLGSALALGTMRVDFPASVWGAVGITSVFATVFAFAVQTYAQRYTPPTRTALIFTGEPVFGALFAHGLGGEPLLGHHLIGGGLIFLGMILAEIRPAIWCTTISSSARKSARGVGPIPPPHSSASG